MIHVIAACFCAGQSWYVGRSIQSSFMCLGCCKSGCGPVPYHWAFVTIGDSMLQGIRPPIRSPDRPARSQSLYRLSYPGPRESLVNINPLTLKLNPSAQRCLTKLFTGDFASWTVHFVNICVKSQQMQQLFIQFINPLPPNDIYVVPHR
jgi:hypothetical protein